ncbi:UPF0146 family protein [Methanococcus voltae]|uniref:UPF0146 protein J3E07_000825 n=2 Tax=Methanococcus voltae TaxID=2188 RepID=A0A8J7UT94_METVO|nr:UPF0146 family protein [Methanococcus voltae]MBP2172670.1 uncharacterized UPF0146 family protein [Methanococcus voltae]MBP2201413.1 uncharacterized UPF0146 family protein [Methanococcus voltae]MCS3922208.1 uncharacterized UPF0146 family protein [Methanococcus voltae PS]
MIVKEFKEEKFNLVKPLYDYLLENYLFENPDLQILELGVGFYFEMALKLKKNNYNVTVMDFNQKAIDNANYLGLDAFKDDLFNPNHSLYREYDIIYSVRPPRDLQNDIYNIAKLNNCKLVIQPLSNETPLESLKVINYNGKILCKL